MNILIVEDDEDKRQQLASFIKSILYSDVVEAKSYNSGLRALIANKFDLILLDMAMPTFDKIPPEKGGREQPFAGRELLQQMSRRGIETKVIVVTQFDIFGRGDDMVTLEQLNTDLKSYFAKTYLGIVHYSVRYTGWQDLLQGFVKSLNLFDFRESSNLN
jgi:CheY-like chemotaxis protein